MKKLFLLLLLAICVSTIAEAQVKEKVAVYISGDVVDGGYKNLLGSKAVTRISRSENYVAVERTAAFLDVLTKEQDYQLSGEVRYDQIAALGVRFGVKYVAVFEVTSIDDTGLISARLIDVESGMIVKSADTNRTAKSIDDWVAMINNVAFRLVDARSK